MVKQVWTAVLLLSAGCAAPTPNVRGVWGGPHVGLTVTDAGSSLEFDCAAGTVPGAFTADAAGRFDLSGTYTPGVGGPEPVDPPPPLSARYSGQVTGRSMTLAVDPEGDVPRGLYTLRQNEPPQIFACL